MARCIIIGGGHAGAQACISLRKEGWTDEIVLISDEHSLPYHRPPLSKNYLLGQVDEKGLLIRPEQAYQKDNITLKLRTRVARIEPALQSVVLQNGERLSYEHLLLCTGSRARKITCSGNELNNIFYIKTLKDIEQLATRLSTDKQRIVMVGGGYIGLETAAVLNKMGHQITLLEQAPRLLARVTAPFISEYYQQLHQQHGVDVLTNTQVLAFTGEQNVTGVRCKTLTQSDTAEQYFNADLVIVGIGAEINTELAEQAGLLVEQNGIVVNELCQTTDKNIYAAGDCTIGIEHHSGIATRIESVPNALAQAKTAAATICGKHQAVTSVPWFWSDQYDCKIQIAGLNHGYDNTVLRQHSSNSFSLWYLKQGRIIAADCINTAKDFMAAKKLIDKKISLPIDMIGNTDIDLIKQLSGRSQAI